MSGIASRVGKGSIWIAASRLVTNLIGLLSMIFLARLLLPTDFGLVAIGTSILTVATAATDLSLGTAIIHHENPDESHLDCAWTLNALRGLILAAIFVAASPAVAHFYRDQRVVMVMITIGASLFCNGLMNPKLVLLQRDLVFWQNFVLQVGQKLTMTVVSVGVALVDRSYLALLAGILAGAMAQLAVSYAFVPYLPRIRFDKFRELFGFSGALTLEQIIQTINFRLDPLIIAKFLNPYGLGLYTISRSLSDIPTRETTLPLTGTLFPALRHIRDDVPRLRAAAMRAQTLISAIALPCGTLMSILAQPFILLIMGQKWLPAVEFVEVFAVTTALQTLGMIAYPLALATGHTKLLLRRSLQDFVFRLPVLISCLYFGGIQGLLLARSLFCISTVLLDMLVVKEISQLSFRDQFLPHWRTLFCCCILMFLSRAIGQYLNFGSTQFELLFALLAQGLVAVAVYCACLIGLWKASNKPPGSEREILGLFARMFEHITVIRKAISARS